MAKPLSRDRLLPALLDRLVDAEPAAREESKDVRAMTKAQLRQSVLRDLSWLLNAQAGLGAEVDLDSLPFVRASTINYGLPALSGRLVSELELPELEGMILQAILDFEPRILPQTLTVSAVRPDRVQGHRNMLDFEITGHLWAEPYPIELLLRTELDLETGLVSIEDRRRGRESGPRHLGPGEPTIEGA